MNNNDILRRLRYIFDYSDAEMAAICAEAGEEVATESVTGWLSREEDSRFAACSDRDLAVFLNGLINRLRGKKDGPQPAPESKLTNNVIFMKLKIALNLQADAVLEILNLVDFPMSKHELSAYFRKPGHRNFRECNDHALRMFLQGLQKKLRPTPYRK
ncbi:DUF1456 family protein [Sulfuriroseicoccus oceanibius]|uniref:DUF1456 family protein n=1 Tax=Sulfuriroseicoccus oceanibius TaxID=2707525 RepID=A0A6B3L7V2_9BACT|nr:DUF1456 family protein [Sulfuriroseicoccus oceanibius]QQL44187.1 DUF1456 family protein [Sulfuriroseicoccus oceanibius]